MGYDGRTGLLVVWNRPTIEGVWTNFVRRLPKFGPANKTYIQYSDLGISTVNGPEGKWEFVHGTGKWEGISGGGKNWPITKGKAVAPGTFQGCRKAQELINCRNKQRWVLGFSLRLGAIKRQSPVRGSAVYRHISGFYYCCLFSSKLCR